MADNQPDEKIQAAERNARDVALLPAHVLERVEELMRTATGMQPKREDASSYQTPEAKPLAAAEPAAAAYVPEEVRGEEAGPASDNKPGKAGVRGEVEELLKQIRDLDPRVRAFLPAGLEERLKQALDSNRFTGIEPDQLRDLLSRIEQEAAAAAEVQESAQRRMDRLWGEVEKRNALIQDDLGALHKEGYLSDELYGELKAERKRIDALPAGSDERREAEKAYADKIKPYAKDVLKRAQDNHDDKMVKVAEDLLKNAELQTRAVEQIAVEKRAQEAKAAEESKIAAGRNTVVETVIAKEPTPIVFSGTPDSPVGQMSSPSPNRAVAKLEPTLGADLG